MERTKEVASTMRHVKPIDEEQFRKIWRWIEKEMVGKKADRGTAED